MARAAHWNLAVLAGIALAAAPAPALAQSEAWSRMAEDDLEAARAFIGETHPGAVPSLGDSTFLGQLRDGYAQARSLARSARTFGGYRAALERFAAAFDDPHIASVSWVQPDSFWPGFLVSSRRGGWEVVDGGADDAPEAGAELISCDGKSPDSLAAAALGPFVPAWAVSAQRMKNSSSLLLDSGNPHRARVQACDFRTVDGRTATHRLNWRRIRSADLAKQFEKLGPRVSEEVALRPFDGGWWIRLGTQSAAALPLMKEVEARQSELRRAPFIIVDLRGNGGGASFISDRIAEVIYGKARVDQAVYPKGAMEPQKVIWRASPTTLSTANGYVERAARLGPDHPVALGMRAQRDSIEAALRRGSPLAEAPDAIDPAAPLRKLDRVRRPPRVILVTDRFCFSSCLQAARLFRDLGATHVGQETNANTHYSNVITTDLPSGLSNFSSLQAYSTYVPRQLGPYAPAIPFKVDLADDRAVEQEVRKLVGAGPRK
ncbi:MAG TPA: hypothetical protein VF535_11505 [Allosphingosinicella sp.]|jgi:hypothetical protein